MAKTKPMTMTEKILAAHAGRREVIPGELLDCRVDLALGNDITAPLAIQAFEAMGARKVFNRDRIVLVPDHFVPPKDILSAEQCKVMRTFAREQRLTHYFEIGEAGIEHALLPDEGLVVPGDLVIGADSHTCTYGAVGAFSTGVGSTDLAAVMATGRLWFKVPETLKLVYYGKVNRWVSGKDLILFTIGDIGVDGALYQAMEFTGEAIRSLPMSSRFTMANMAIEAGGKNGIFEFDAETKAYVDHRCKLNGTRATYDPVERDKDETFVYELVVDLSRLEPTVACHPDPGQRRLAKELGNIKLDRAYIGSCTGGKTSDFLEFARVLQGRRVAIDTFGVPATPEIVHDLQTARWGDQTVWEILVSAGVQMTENAGCAACLGGPVDTFGRMNSPMKCISATNRNFPGRMGHKESQVFLASPATVAASAITGRITDPREFLS